MADDRRWGRASCATGKIALAVLATGLAVAACTSTSSPTAPSAAGSTTVLPSDKAGGRPIDIGYISPEGSPEGSLPEAREAAQATVEYINDNLGGLHGRALNLVVCKEKEDPATAHDCANQLVSDHVAAVVSPVTSQGDAIVPTVTGAGIAYVSGEGAAASEMVTPGAFVLTSGVPGGLAAAAQYAAQHHYKRMAMVIVDTGAVAAGLKVIAGPAFQQAGVQLQTVPIPPGTPDTTPQISAALGQHPDVIAVLGDGPLCTSALEALQTLGSTVDKMVVQTCVSSEVVAAAGSAVQGAHDIGSADLDSDDPEAVLFRTVMAKYAPGTSTTGGAFFGYQTVLGLYRA